MQDSWLSLVVISQRKFGNHVHMTIRFATFARMLRRYQEGSLYDFCSLVLTCLFGKLVYPLSKVSGKGLCRSDTFFHDGEPCYANYISGTLRLSMISI